MLSKSHLKVLAVMAEGPLKRNCVRGVATAIAVLASLSVCFAGEHSKTAVTGEATTLGLAQNNAQGDSSPSAQQQLAALQVPFEELWGSSGYGMSVADVLKTVPQTVQAPPNTNNLADGAQNLVDGSVQEVGGEKFIPHFYFSAGRLEQVTLSLIDLSGAIDNDRVQLIFTNTAAALHTMYGDETASEEPIPELPLYTRKKEWLHNGTTIRLYLAYVKGANHAGAFNITYQRQLHVAKQAAVAEVMQAVGSWEANVRARDPDYDRKALAVQRLVQALMQERGAPRNAQEAVSLAQEAYDRATSELSRAPGSARLQTAPQQPQSQPSMTSAQPQAQGGTPAEFDLGRFVMVATQAGYSAEQVRVLAESYIFQSAQAGIIDWKTAARAKIMLDPSAFGSRPIP